MFAGSVLRKIERRARFHLGLPKPKEEVRLLGHELTLYEGTVSKEADKDDAWLLALARDSRCMMDVGANIGQSAVLALVAGVERLVCVEAAAPALMMCVENVLTNFPSATFTPVMCFASNADGGTTPLYTYRHGAANSMFASHANTAAKHGTRLDVPNRTLSAVARDTGIQPDLVKIDIEGAESLALEGARELARDHQPRFMVEMHSCAELPMRDNAGQVLDWCASEGYTAHYMAEHTPLKSPETIGHRGRCHLLLCPADQPYPSYLPAIPQGAPLGDLH